MNFLKNSLGFWNPDHIFDHILVHISTSPVKINNFHHASSSTHNNPNLFPEELYCIRELEEFALFYATYFPYLSSLLFMPAFAQDFIASLSSLILRLYFIQSNHLIRVVIIVKTSEWISSTNAEDALLLMMMIFAYLHIVVWIHISLLTGFRFPIKRGTPRAGLSQHELLWQEMSNDVLCVGWWSWIVHCAKVARIHICTKR